MKPDAEFRVFSGITGRFTGGRPSRHKACAGYDAMLVRFYDAPVYSRALAEVIGIDDKILLTAHGCGPKENLGQDYGAPSFRPAKRFLRRSFAPKHFLAAVM